MIMFFRLKNFMRLSFRKNVSMKMFTIWTITMQRYLNLIDMKIINTLISSKFARSIVNVFQVRFQFGVTYIYLFLNFEKCQKRNCISAFYISYSICYINVHEKTFNRNFLSVLYN